MSDGVGLFAEEVSPSEVWLLGRIIEVIEPDEPSAWPESIPISEEAAPCSCDGGEHICSRADLRRSLDCYHA